VLIIALIAMAVGLAIAVAVSEHHLILGVTIISALLTIIIRVVKRRVAAPDRRFSHP
jgi:hypothetical protein